MLFCLLSTLQVLLLQQLTFKLLDWKHPLEDTYGRQKETVPRLMLVLDPIEVRLDNLTMTFEFRTVVHLYKQGNDEFGKRTANSELILTDLISLKMLVISHFRLTQTNLAGLLKVPKVLIQVFGKRFQWQNHQDPCHLTTLESTIKKPKTYIQWVSAKSSIPVKEVRLYNQLFKSETLLLL